MIPSPATAASNHSRKVTVSKEKNKTEAAGFFMFFHVFVPESGAWSFFMFSFYLNPEKHEK
jgi:hypothetical protein